MTEGVRDVAALQEECDRQQALLQDIRERCQFKTTNRRSPTSGTGRELAMELLELINSYEKGQA